MLAVILALIVSLKFQLFFLSSILFTPTAIFYAVRIRKTKSQQDIINFTIIFTNILSAQLYLILFLLADDFISFLFYEENPESLRQ